MSLNNKAQKYILSLRNKGYTDRLKIEIFLNKLFKNEIIIYQSKEFHFKKIQCIASNYYRLETTVFFTNESDWIRFDFYKATNQRFKVYLFIYFDGNFKFYEKFNGFRKIYKYLNNTSREQWELKIEKALYSII